MNCRREGGTPAIPYLYFLGSKDREYYKNQDFFVKSNLMWKIWVNPMRWYLDYPTDQLIDLKLLF